MTPATNSFAAKVPQPPAAPGFERIKRYWDPACVRWSAKILPGEFFVTRSDEAITTVLGSCIAACIRDPMVKIGGMNHFMLPEDNSVGKSAWLDGPGALSTRYGSYAMESLINELMKLGARRERLEVKLFGGGKILSSMTDVGEKNISFARQFLKVEGFKIAAEDVGDVFPRRVMYFPTTGVAMLKRLRALDVVEIAQRERNYHSTITTKSADADADVELFD
jgi:chemotaxis protein CheD